tara:strand:+ start:247 stop:1248 length:1002 start_codon:yes stop_codon:yes gene_type:complete
MSKPTDFFSIEELYFLRKKRPDLRMMNEQPTYCEPENPLTPPSVDQMIIEFLKQQEVYIQPRSVGEWNGWDTVSVLSSILSSGEGSMINLASTMFYANRSNQINTAAQEWSTWKRWALDNEEFQQYRREILQSIDLYNGKYNQVDEERIRIAKLYNSEIIKKFQDPNQRKYFFELIEEARREEVEERNIKLYGRGYSVDESQKESAESKNIEELNDFKKDNERNDSKIYNELPKIKTAESQPKNFNKLTDFTDEQKKILESHIEKSRKDLSYRSKSKSKNNFSNFSLDSYSFQLPRRSIYLYYLVCGILFIYIPPFAILLALIGIIFDIYQNR